MASNLWNERNIKGPVNNTRLQHAPDLGKNFQQHNHNFKVICICFQIYQIYENFLNKP